MGTFKAGDIVQLKSGGPLMTVQAVGNFDMATGITDGVKCIWFDEKNKHQTMIFESATLEPYTEDVSD